MKGRRQVREGRARRAIRRRLDREGGFTLAELLTALLIFALLVVAIFNVLSTNIRAASIYALRSELGQELRETLDNMCDQVRLGISVSEAGAENIVFSGYVTGSDLIYTVSYSLSGSDLVYDTEPDIFGAGPAAIASHVDSLSFTYYDEKGSVLPEPSGEGLAAIASVGIELAMTLTSDKNRVSDSAAARVGLRK